MGIDKKQAVDIFFIIPHELIHGGRFYEGTVVFYMGNGYTNMKKVLRIVPIRISFKQ